MKHGAFATSTTYEAALRAANPDLFDSAGGDPDVRRELAFARARLGVLAQDPTASPETVARLLDTIRRLAEAQRAKLEGERDKPADPSLWRLTIVESRKPEAEPSAAAQRDPVDPPGKPG